MGSRALATIRPLGSLIVVRIDRDLAVIWGRPGTPDRDNVQVKPRWVLTCTLPSLVTTSMVCGRQGPSSRPRMARSRAPTVYGESVVPQMYDRL